MTKRHEIIKYFLFSQKWAGVTNFTNKAHLMCTKSIAEAKFNNESQFKSNSSRRDGGGEIHIKGKHF